MNKKLLVALVLIIVVAAAAVPAVYYLATKKGPSSPPTPSSVQPKNNAPVAQFAANVTKAFHGGTVGYDASSSHDPDNDPLSYSWDFGDGAKGDGVKTSHTFAEDGTYVINLTVSDGKASSWTTRVTNIINAPPVIISYLPASASFSIMEGETQNFSITASTSDGDFLFTNWTLDNKSVRTNVSRYTFSTNSESAGSYKVKVTVTDGKLEVWREWNLTVNNVNRPPSIVLVEPFGNFTVAEGAQVTIKATAEDPDNDVLTYVWVVDANVRDNGTGYHAELNYTPDYRSSGFHSAKVTFSDGPFQISTSWNITVRNTNRAPLIESLTPNTTTTINETARCQLSVVAADPDGDPLTYNWTLDGAPVQSNSVNNYDFVTNYSSEGSYKLGVDVSDGKLESSVRWNITVLNHNRLPVVKASVDFKTLNTGQLFNFNSNGSFDPDGDPITFFWEFGDGNNTTSENTSHAYFRAAKFRVNLTVTDICGTAAKTTLEVAVKPGLMEAWKMGPFSGKTDIMVAGDVDADGKNELVAAINGEELNNVAHGHITIFNIATHAEKWSSPDIGDISGIALANLDQDTALEIVIGTFVQRTGDQLNMNLTGKLMVIDGASHATEWEDTSMGAISSVAVVDVDGDFQLEILAGCARNLTVNLSTQSFHFDGGLAVFAMNHSLLWNSSGWGAVDILAAENMDTDAYTEVALRTILTSGPAGTNETNITVIEWRTGTFYRQGELKDNIGLTLSSFKLADVNTDNNKELLLGSSQSSGGTYVGNASAYSPSLSQLWKSGNIGGVLSLEAADVDPNSPNMEILLGTAELDQGTLSGRMIVFSSSWTEVWRTGDIGFVQAIGYADLNNDAGIEILVGAAYYVDSDGTYNSTIHVYSGNLRQELSNQTGFNGFSARFIILDGDNDGVMEFLIAEWLQVTKQSFIRLLGM
jgi:PKD repeat protein